MKQNLLVDLNLRGKIALAIIFDREEALTRLRQLEETQAKITVVTSKDIALAIKKQSSVRIKIIETNSTTASFVGLVKKAIETSKPFFTVISTWSDLLDLKVSDIARKTGSLVYVVDSPKLNDLNMPAVARFGEIRVAISTGGLSPAMASTIRRRLEREIRKEDILQVKLQGELRNEIKKALPSIEQRKKLIYDLLSNESIRDALSHGKYSRAVSLARRRIESRS